MSQKLDSLVRDTEDTSVHLYILENLGKNIPMNRCQRAAVVKIKQKTFFQLAQIQWNPQANRLRLKTVQIQKAYRTFLRNMIENDIKQREFLQMMIDEAEREDEGFIALKLKDQQPINRWLALQVVQRRWYPMEHLILELLEDPFPVVRNSARETLVRLSRGQDFGPLPNANIAQVRNSRAAWQNWLDAETVDRGSRTRKFNLKGGQ